MLQPLPPSLVAGMGETRAQGACSAGEHLVWRRAVERRVRHHGVVLRQDRCPSQGPLGRFPDSDSRPRVLQEFSIAISLRRSIAKNQKTLGRGHGSHITPPRPHPRPLLCAAARSPACASPPAGVRVAAPGATGVEKSAGIGTARLRAARLASCRLQPCGVASLAMGGTWRDDAGSPLEPKQQGGEPGVK